MAEKESVNRRQIWTKLLGHGGNSQRSNIHIIRIQKEERKSVVLKKIFEEIMIENLPSLVNDVNLQLQEAEQIPNTYTERNPLQIHPNQTAESLRQRKCFESSWRKITLSTGER